MLQTAAAAAAPALLPHSESEFESCHTFDICFGVEHELTVSQAS